MAQGADVVIDHVGPNLQWNAPWDRQPGAMHRILGLAEPYEADVVVMQRPGRRWWSDMIPLLQAQGIRVVVDVDDLFDGIDHHSHVAHKEYQGDVVNHAWVDRACELADQVTVTTPALLKRYGHGHGVVLPNRVPESYLFMRPEKVHRSIGWTGFVGTHPGDLQTTGGAIAQVLGARPEWSFHVVGPRDGVKTALSLRSEPVATGPVPFAAYPAQMARLEVGIVPLEPSRFNSAKSALKACEFAALGVPVVMSPTPDNQRVHDLGIGVMATSRSSWIRSVGRLADNEQRRTELAEAGRAAIKGQTYEQHADQWWSAWTGGKA